MSDKEKQDLAKINEIKKQGEALAKPIIEKMNQAGTHQHSNRQSTGHDNGRRMTFGKSPA